MRLIEQFKLHPIRRDMATINMSLGITHHMRASMVRESRPVAEIIAQFPIIAEKDEVNYVNNDSQSCCNISHPTINSGNCISGLLTINFILRCSSLILQP